MKCWICGSDADSGEHRAKKSDLDMVFSNVTQKTPVYAKTEPGGIDRIGSLKSDKFKSDAKLCHDCNTSRSQPFDKAWEKLSVHLQNNMSNLKNQKKMKLQTVFPGSVEKSMLNVHLYFIKIFGCLIKEHNVPIPLAPFSNAIMQGAAHPQVYMGFGYREKVRKNNIVLLTKIESITSEGKVHFANWQYWVRNVFVDVIYSIDENYMKIVREFWHPDNTQKILKLSELKNNQRAIQETWV